MTVCAQDAPPRSLERMYHICTLPPLVSQCLPPTPQIHTISVLDNALQMIAVPSSVKIQRALVKSATERDFSLLPFGHGNEVYFKAEEVRRVGFKVRILSPSSFHPAYKRTARLL
jgi:hypothetical protein